MIDLELLKYKASLRLRKIGQQPQIFDPIRRKWVAYQPEESVRQLFIAFCMTSGFCSSGRISVERELEIHGMRRRYDIVLHDASGQPWMLVECKAPSVTLSQSVMDQVARYNLALRVPYLLITNGWATIACHLDMEQQSYTYIDALPGSGAG